MSEGGAGGPIEQLHYTWAPRGAEGMNKFQIAAISAGLKRPPLFALLPDLRRLCRYDRPPGAAGDAPASFGWLDLGQQRVAFLRVAVPGVAGRSGSFAAHLLVGDPASLPEAEIASSFGAGFWWTGLTDEELDEIAAGKQDFELPPIDWNEALETRVAPGSDAIEAAGALTRDLLSLDGGERLAVLDDGSGFGSVLRTLGRRLPGAFAGVSLSTYEVASVFPFTVVGTPERPPGMRVCELAASDDLDPDCRATAQQLLGDHPEAELLRAAVGHLTGPGPGGRAGGSRWDTAQTLVGLSAGTVADPGPLASRADPYAVAYLACTEPGRERIAEMATGKSSQPLAALVQARERIAPAHLDGLCLAFARRFAASGELRGCAEVLAALPSGPARKELEEEVLRIALRSESAGATIGSDDAVALLRIAAARGLDTERCRPLLHQAARHVDACAEDLVLPDAMLAAMLPIALEKRGTEAELCRALRRRPRLLSMALPGAGEEERWLALGRRLRSQQLEEALPALLAGLARQPQRELSALVGRLPDRAGQQALVAAGDLFDRGALPPELAKLCEARAATALGNGELGMAQRLLAHGRSGDSQLAADLLARSRTSTAERVRAAYRVDAIRDPILRDAVFAAAVDWALRELRHPDDVGLVWSLLASSYPGEDDEATLERLLEHAMRAPPSSGQAVLLVWLSASLLPARPELRKRNGQPKNRTSTELIATLAQRMSEPEIEHMEPFAEAGDRRAARWWKGLVADHRKALERHGR